MPVRLYRARAIAQATPDRRIDLFHVQVTAVEPELKAVRLYRASARTVQNAVFLRVGGAWQRIELFARQFGGWR